MLVNRLPQQSVAAFISCFSHQAADVVRITAAFGFNSLRKRCLAGVVGWFRAGNPIVVLQSSSKSAAVFLHTDRPR
jgi:hypothetical protein